MTMANRLLMLCLPACLAACSLDQSAPSSFRPEDQPSLAAEKAPAPYAARSRARDRAFTRGVLPIISAAKKQAALIRQDVDIAVSDLRVPERYATSEPRLRRFHDGHRDAYADAVQKLYKDALARIDAQHEQSLQAAESLARSMAGDRSPLDAGASGDPLLDNKLRAFEETLRMTLDRSRLEAVGYQRAQHQIDKLELFTSFTSEGADEAMGGRLMLFVGGDEQTDLPICDVVLRTQPGIAPEERGLFQVVRYRVMAGATIVEDMGWTPLPRDTGLPAVDIWGERFLIAPGLAPKLRTSVKEFDQLRALRVVADVQTLVFDRSRTVLGGVDWRLEFRVSEMGALTWQPSAMQPSFNFECAEGARLLPGLADR
jgi:hypothetical protein